MFPSSLHAALTAIVAYTVAVSAAPAVSTTPSLTVETSTSDVSVDELENLKTTTIVVSTGDETPKPLGDPRGALDSFPENTFPIADSSGSRPSFSGTKINYKSAVGDPNAFTLLAHGDSIDITHDPSAAYDFTRSGTGDYSVELSNQFTHVDGDGTPKEMYAKVGDITEVKLSGDRTTGRWGNTFVDCSEKQQAEIAAASKTAQKTVAEAYTYMKHVTFGSERYKKWFGPYDDKRKDTVLKTFKNIKQNTKFKLYTYDCSRCKREGKHELPSGRKNFAYLLPDTHPGVMMLCPRFFELPPDGIRSKTDTLIHESTHFRENAVRGTISRDDWYGPVTCESMAAQDPKTAVKNADNLAFFAVNSPKLP